MTETSNAAPAELPAEVRTKRRGLWKRVNSPAWGVGYAPAEESGPDAPPSFRLLDGFSRIPRTLHQAWVRLAFATCDGTVKSVDSGSEVAVILARDAATLREWRMFVPRQEVGGVSVKANLQDLADLVTGERFPGLPEGWLYAGSSHSHNTMKAFFSSTDDRDELSLPGLHYVLGEIDQRKRTYGYIASIVLRGVRHLVDFDAVIDAETDLPDGQGHYHESVLEMIERPKVRETKPRFPSHGSYLDGFRLYEGNESDAEDAAELAGLDTSFALEAEADAEWRELLAKERQAAIREARKAIRSLPDKSEQFDVRMIINALDGVVKHGLSRDACDIVWRAVSDVLESDEEYLR